MRNLYLLAMALMTAITITAQPVLQPSDINFVSQTDLANCSDTSAYYMDTVTVVGYVVTDGGLAEVASSSINGANGIRPFIFLNDTANGGAVGPWTGLEVMGVNWGTNQATSGFTALIEGDLVEITGVVGMFSSATQFQPLDNNSITILSSSFPTISPAKVNVGDLNDQNQVNKLPTGEQWEGSFIEVNNVTVTSVNTFGSGTGARFEFTVADSAGNSMQIYDFFVAQRLSTWNTLNPNSPYSNGIFNPPSVGTFFTSLKGVVEHSGNGCTGGSGQGYRLHPFDSTHYEVGQAAPTLSNITITPTVPTSSDPITVEADVADPDGNIDSVHIFWSNDTSLPLASFTKASMSLVSGSTYDHTIPAQANNTIVSYYIRAVDDDQNTSLYPATPAGQQPNVAYIYVRDNGLTIMDVQTPFSGSGDASPFEDQEVTVRGFVTAAEQNCDLGYVYIQDSSATEYAGLALRASLDLSTLVRNEYVEVTGTIQESFGFTQMLISNINSLGSGYKVMPVEVDPKANFSSEDYEKYESMLITYRDPAGAPINITDPDLGFGEYAISSDPNPASNANERRVLAGRASGTTAQSSLYFSLVSDSSYTTQDGTMQVNPIKTDASITMDALTGILWYSFGNFKLTPRNNFDVENLSITPDTASCSFPVFSIAEVRGVPEVQLYPNPARSEFHIEAGNTSYTAELYDLKGSRIARQQSEGGERMTFNTSPLKAGVYVLKVTSSQQMTGTYKVVIRP